MAGDNMMLLWSGTVLVVVYQVVARLLDTFFPRRPPSMLHTVGVTKVKDAMQLEDDDDDEYDYVLTEYRYGDCSYKLCRRGHALPLWFKSSIPAHTSHVTKIVAVDELGNTTDVTEELECFAGVNGLFEGHDLSLTELLLYFTNRPAAFVVTQHQACPDTRSLQDFVCEALWPTDVSPVTTIHTPVVRSSL